MTCCEIINEISHGLFSISKVKTLDGTLDWGYGIWLVYSQCAKVPDSTIAATDFTMSLV
jgi:hypothetical protein